MDSTQFILERLNWPIRFARLQSAREYANLIANSSFRPKALDAYFSWLKERRTENETCSGLVVLLAAEPTYLPNLNLLKENIRTPSILADMMLEEVYGPQASADDWVSRHSGQAPPSFEPDEYFLRNSTAQVPPSLGEELTRMERVSGLPFMKQWGFEWENTRAATEAPYSGFPYHFLDGALERSGVSTQIDQRQGDIYRSAYLRTLHCGVDLWQMPLEVAYEAATKCLPVTRGLIDIERSNRPHWLGALPDECAADGVQLEHIVREIVKAAATSGTLVPVHLKTPLSLNISEFSSLTITCALLSEDYVPHPGVDIAALGTAGWELPTGALFSGQACQLKPESHFRLAANGKCLPLCVDIFPFPFGYWLGDLFQTGLSLPASYVFPHPISYRCSEGGILIEVDRQPVGRWMTWNDHWTNLYPKDGNTRCGSISEMRPADILAAADQFGLRVGWNADVKVWRSDTSYGELKLNRKSVHFLDDGELIR